ncbi:ParA family protein [Candidatus Bipolaricaulota bacterium]|nr:ParA family protein [Candidatus Bipolaricaulota bacterium]
MKKIAIINQKGGTGKTTTAVNLGKGLADRDLKTLLIDVDPQGNLATWFGSEFEQTLYNLLVDDESPESCILEMEETLHLIPSDESTAQAEKILTGKTSRETILKRRLQVLNSYDFVILDCPPSLSLLNQNALVYAESAFIPVSMDYLALVGVKNILKNIRRINELLEHEVEVELVIPTLFDIRTNESKEILEKLKDHFDGKVTEPIRTNVRLSEAASYNQSIFEYAPDSHGAEDYEKLVERVIENG